MKTKILSIIMIMVMSMSLFALSGNVQAKTKNIPKPKFKITKAEVPIDFKEYKKGKKTIYKIKYYNAAYVKITNYSIFNTYRCEWKFANTIKGKTLKKGKRDGYFGAYKNTKMKNDFFTMKITSKFGNKTRSTTKSKAMRLGTQWVRVSKKTYNSSLGTVILLNLFN